MEETPVALDDRRGMAAQKATELRRRLELVAADQESLRLRQAELEKYMLSAPASDWPEAAEKARYLLGLFAATPEARDPRRQKLIADVLAEFQRLIARPVLAERKPAP
jgi:hypothetical protein